jgi:hypothetical protein
VSQPSAFSVPAEALDPLQPFLLQRCGSNARSSGVLRDGCIVAQYFERDNAQHIQNVPNFVARVEKGSLLSLRHPAAVLKYRFGTSGGVKRAPIRGESRSIR